MRIGTATVLSLNRAVLDVDARRRGVVGGGRESLKECRDRLGVAEQIHQLEVADLVLEVCEVGLERHGGTPFVVEG